MHNIIECYTDCSYSPQTGLCVVGYKIGDNNIVTELLINIKNTQGEIYAVEKCIEICKNHFIDNYTLLIHTDCQRVIQNTYPNVEFVKMEGHKRKALKTPKDLIFSKVDKKVRNDLRMHVEKSLKNSAFDKPL
jgi:hypothetical protein